MERHREPYMGTGLTLPVTHFHIIDDYCRERSMTRNKLLRRIVREWMLAQKLIDTPQDPKEKASAEYAKDRDRADTFLRRAEQTAAPSDAPGGSESN
jgi:hypothetical protein